MKGEKGKHIRNNPWNYRALFVTALRTSTTDLEHLSVLPLHIPGLLRWSIASVDQNRRNIQ